MLRLVEKNCIMFLDIVDVNLEQCENLSVKPNTVDLGTVPRRETLYK
jgi:hypothetical protein